MGTREKKDTTEISGSDPDNPGASIWVIDRFGISYILYAKGYGTGNIAAVYVGSAEKSVKKKGDYPLRTSSAILFLGAKLGTCSEGIIILNYGNYHIVINDIPRGKQSPRLMYDTSKTSLDRNFILDVKFTDGATLRETTLREVGSGEKITVVIDANGAHTALRKAASW